MKRTNERLFIHTITQQWNMQKGNHLVPYTNSMNKIVEPDLSTKIVCGKQLKEFW